MPASELNRDWPFLYDASTDTLFHRTGLGITSHRRMYHDFDKDPQDTDCEPPDTAIPVLVNVRPATWTLLSHQPSQLPAPTPQPTTIVMSIPTYHLWEQALFHSLQFVQPELHVWKALSHGPCIIATDGSAPQGKGSFTWIISDQQGNRIVKCSGPVHGHRITSYRAEGYGILSALRFLLWMNELYATPDRPQL